jgi:hypothetical protein
MGVAQTATDGARQAEIEWDDVARTATAQPTALSTA